MNFLRNLYIPNGQQRFVSPANAKGHLSLIPSGSTIEAHGGAVVVTGRGISRKVNTALVLPDGNVRDFSLPRQDFLDLDKEQREVPAKPKSPEELIGDLSLQRAIAIQRIVDSALHTSTSDASLKNPFRKYDDFAVAQNITKAAYTKTGQPTHRKNDVLQQLLTNHGMVISIDDAIKRLLNLKIS